MGDLRARMLNVPSCPDGDVLAFAGRVERNIVSNLYRVFRVIQRTVQVYSCDPARPPLRLRKKTTGDA